MAIKLTSLTACLSFVLGAVIAFHVAIEPGSDSINEEFSNSIKNAHLIPKSQISEANNLLALETP